MPIQCQRRSTPRFSSAHVNQRPSAAIWAGVHGSARHGLEVRTCARGRSRWKEQLYPASSYLWIRRVRSSGMRRKLNNALRSRTERSSDEHEPVKYVGRGRTVGKTKVCCGSSEVGRAKDAPQRAYGRMSSAPHKGSTTAAAPREQGCVSAERKRSASEPRRAL